MTEPPIISPSGKVDRKLAHLVKKMMNPNDTSPPNTDYVVTILRTQHREYQRKNALELKKQVEVAVSYLLSTSNQQQQTQQTLPPSQTTRKRRTIDQEEQLDDVLAVREEALRESAGVGGGLNASLRNRYRQQQQEAQQQEEKASSEASSNREKGAEISTPEQQSATLAVVGKLKKRKRAKATTPNPTGSSSNFDDVSFLTPLHRPKERYSDLGGMDSTILELRQLVEYPLLRPELYRHLGIEPPRGVLLRGPPGTGKSHLANAVAGELDVSYFRLSAPELVSGMSGESEGRIRDLFKAASDHAPSIIFLDEIDAVAPKRSEAGSTRGMEKRMVAQLLTSMDSISPDRNNENASVIVLAATNRPDSLNSALRRAGRFDREILLGVPDEEARERILRAMTVGMRLSGDFDFKLLARKTPGFVGADICSLSKEAAALAINRIIRDVLPTESAKGKTVVKDNTRSLIVRPDALTPEQMEPLFVTMTDFLDAIPSVQPSSKREGFATVPDVSWDDIGALQSIREELTISVLEPIRNPEKFKALGLIIHAGVLLYGPPGCGKTLLAKAIANESGANFISVKGPELLDKYVGESERAVRVVFERARASSPCVVFFDELDSLVPKRGRDSGGGGVSERVVNQLLTELDGLDSRRSVFVIAATNRPELIDPAMLRPGRLDKLLFVPLPTPQDRVSILKALASSVKLGNDVDLEKIGSSSRAAGYSGADCAALLREAGLAVIREGMSDKDALDVSNDEGETPLCISNRHFDIAVKAVLPSVSSKDQKRYDRIRERMASARIRTIEERSDQNDEPTLHFDNMETDDTEADDANAGTQSQDVKAQSIAMAQIVSESLPRENTTADVPSKVDVNDDVKSPGIRGETEGDELDAQTKKRKEGDEKDAQTKKTEKGDEKDTQAKETEKGGVETEEAPA